VEQGARGEAEIQIDAPPTAVYAVVTDVTRMGEWSPETVKCEWLDGATGAAVGARFKGTNQRGWARWSTKPTVVEADPGREFAFDVDGLVKWTYRFEAQESGTRLVESFELLGDLPWRFRFAHRYIMRTRDRRADLEHAMQATLERIKRAVEGVR
jgi:uncharacterized protein YndB with AHSA1/START domain